MCQNLANNGHRIIMLKEDVRISSPDILLDNTTAELKKLSSHNNIVKEAKDAIKKKGAQIIVFEFEHNTKEIHQQLLILYKSGIKCKYYFKDVPTKIYEL